MIEWLTLPESTRERICREIAEDTGLSPFAVEKDWWVVQTLSVIFEMEVAKYLVFKGGTSLSKAWNLIQRFSEDVDLAIDREFFGFSGELSKNKRTELRKAASDYTSGPFFEELKERFAARGIGGVSFGLVPATSTDQDPRIIEIGYPNLVSTTGYMLPKVLVEIGCRSLREPFTVRTFASMVDEGYPRSGFALPPVNIPTVNPERTFLEKVFLLHEEFQRPMAKMRVERLGRHLYDVVKLSKTEYADKALADATLYQTIVDHRHTYARVGGVNYNLHQPQTINPVPIPAVLESWKEDYQASVAQMIYESSPPSFEEILRDLNSLKARINSLPWQLDKEYPISPSV
jgi:hypothetical protein